VTRRRTALTTVQIRQMVEEYETYRALRARLDALMSAAALQDRYQVGHTTFERAVRRHRQEKGTHTNGRN